MKEIRYKKLSTNGVELHTAIQGQGPLIVFCHGFPGHWSQWKHQMQAVAEAGFTALALDMRGYGNSTRPEHVSDYCMDKQLADLCGVLDALEVQQAIFIGQDFGAPIVWNMAQRHADRVKAVIGISVPFDHDYSGRSCLGHLPEAESKDGLSNGLLFASPLNPPTVGFNQVAEHQFMHAHYFQKEGPADKELAENAREFLQNIYWGLSAKGGLGDWSVFPSEGTSYLDVLPKSPSLPWPWMSVADMDEIEKAYLSAGKTNAFTGGLANYRVADMNWYSGKQFAADNILVPAIFLAGADDPVIQALDDACFERMEVRVKDLRGIHLIPNAGHFVQLEQAETCSQLIVEFSQSIN